MSHSFGPLVLVAFAGDPCDSFVPIQTSFDSRKVAVLFDEGNGSAAEADCLRDLVLRHGRGRQYAAVVVVTDDQTWAADGFSRMEK